MSLIPQLYDALYGALMDVPRPTSWADADPGVFRMVVWEGADALATAVTWASDPPDELDPIVTAFANAIGAYYDERHRLPSAARLDQMAQTIVQERAK